MAGTTFKKRSFSGDGPKGGKGGVRPTKKQRQAAAYHSSSSEGEDGDDSDSDDNEDGAPIPDNLFDSDDADLDNIEVDDGGSSGEDSEGSDAENQSDSKSPRIKKTAAKPTKPNQPKFVAKDAPDSGGDSSGDDDGSDDGEGSDFGSDTNRSSKPNSKSKRNDPEAFATSISKMLSSKLPVSRRADPIVARSAESAVAARQLVDSALETKARKRLREQKRLAMEKGRVRNVLIASTTRTLNFATGEVEEVVEEGADTTAEIMATERRLRKVAQRGVVKLFNAVRAAQVKAADAQRVIRGEGIVGVKRKEEKITEMSKKGFLDLIASGGGGLKKGGLEEA
ncbi:Rrp15p-domain-containing protein [Lasiosphaeria ovina]|uniref:Rrp15p-domain-containing protein n=1 Tax=Lasiosphaeria ovina TaxID=92902 RepID=A0AAE0N8N7_9PEZI|nr:Rrp15p-domain-containing protein [Lasiosphaeria ovina]